MLLLLVVDREQAVWGDVRVYASWTSQNWTSFGSATLDEYPALARLLLLAVRTDDLVAFAAVFFAVMAAVDAILLLRLEHVANATGRQCGVLLWILAPAALGALVWSRFDLIAVALVIGALTTTRSVVGRLLGTLAVLIKAWPLLVLPAIGRHTRPGTRWFVLIVGTSLIGFAALFWVPGGTSFGWMKWAFQRGIQIESTPGLVLALAGALGADATVAYNYGSWQISMPGAIDSLLAVGLAGVGAAGIAVLTVGSLRTTRAASTLVAAPLAVGLLLLTSKVFSPQYVLWLVGLCCVLLTLVDLKRPRALLLTVLALAAVTHLIYPLTYIALLRLETGPILMLLARALLLAGIVALLLGELRQGAGSMQIGSPASERTISEPDVLDRPVTK